MLLPGVGHRQSQENTKRYVHIREHRIQVFPPQELKQYFSI